MLSLLVVVLFSLAVLLFVPTSDAFTTPLMLKQSQAKTLSATRVYASIYQQRLEEARRMLRDARRQPFAQQSENTPATTRSAEKNPSFTDEMYDKMKFLIEKLTMKLKHDQVFGEEELHKYETYVHDILLDARGYNAEPSAAKVNHDIVVNSNIEILSIETDSSTPFDAIEGLGSTWNIPGMDDMSTKEYYEAINKRNAQIQAIRNTSNHRFRPEQMDSFLQNLSRRHSSS